MKYCTYILSNIEDYGYIKISVEWMYIYMLYILSWDDLKYIDV